MKVWHAIEITISRIAESAVTAQLWSANTTGLEISEDTPEAITLRAYFESPPDSKKLQANILRALALSGLSDSALHSFQLLTIADQDWLAEWKKGYEPVQIGEKLLIAPSWKREQIAASERVIIQIDPGMAFGTGTHETTRGCLELLEKYWRGRSLLDVGTGTGILAIAAIKLFPNSHIIGFDVDPEAIDVAHENAEINGVADNLKFEVNHLTSFDGQGFDLILANLTADVIIPLAPLFPKAINAVGVLIISGILREQGDETLATLAAQGFRLLESKPDGEWVSFALTLQS